MSGGLEPYLTDSINLYLEEAKPSASVPGSKFILFKYDQRVNNCLI